MKILTINRYTLNQASAIIILAVLIIIITVLLASLVIITILATFLANKL